MGGKYRDVPLRDEMVQANRSCACIFVFKPFPLARTIRDTQLVLSVT
jgi:hypothetical protein